MQTNPNSIITIYNNVFNWVSDIGYTHSSDTKRLNIEELKNKFSFYPYVMLPTVANRESDQKTEHKYLYIFIIIDKTYVSKTDSFLKLLNNVKYDGSRVIIVADPKIKVNIENAKKRARKSNLKILHYPNYLFKVDIRNNIMVGKHTICDSKELKKIMQHNNITDKQQFPKIFITDSQVRLLDANIGDVIKIMRNTPKGILPYYRVVINHV